MHLTRRETLRLTAAGVAGAAAMGATDVARAAAEERRLYVAVPGVRDYTEWGGVGILVYDVDHGHRLLRRIPIPEPAPGAKPEAMKGICACARTGRLYVTTPTRLICLDLRTDAVLWQKRYAGGCDRMAISPDGKTLYVPSFEGPHWTVVDGDTGDVITRIQTKDGAHNTIFGLDGRHVYLAQLKVPELCVANAATHAIVKRVGPFSNVIRPFTVNGAQTLCFVNVNDLLGFEVGDLRTGKKLARVEVAGYTTGPVDRHGCPSHGIALTPDERELWLTDAHNRLLHVFDATVMPPKQKDSIPVRYQPGWITFSRNGLYAYPSSGEVIEPRSRKVVTTLADEAGRPVQSEKLLEVVFRGGKPVRNGDQFGLGRAGVG